MSSKRYFGLFVALAFVWGASFMAIKAGLAYFPPVLFAGFRYDIAGVLLLAYALAVGGQWRPSSRREWGYILVNGPLLIGVHFTLLFTGQQYVTSAVAAIVLSLTPVLTPAFAWAVLPDERITAVGALGMVFGVAGVAIIAQPDPSNLGTEFYGVVLLFLAAASFALGSVLTKRMPATLPLAPMQAWIMLTGAGILHVLSVLFGESAASVQWTTESVSALLYLAVVAGAGGFLVYFHLLDQLGPIEINLVNYAVPVFAALTGWVVLGEQITATTIAGFLVIATGFALVKARRLQREYAMFRTRFTADADRKPVLSDGGLPDTDERDTYR